MLRKQILIAVLFTALCDHLHAQYSKYIIQFTDKGNSTFTLGAPSAYLSARAIARRTNYMLTYDSTDLPVTAQYINTVLAQGNITLLSRSKWLNQILIQTVDPAALNKIQALPFVKKTAAAGLKKSQTINEDKFTETVKSLNSNATSKQEGDVLNYGNSYNQVHIHNGEYLHNKGFLGQGIVIAMLDGGFNSYKTNSFLDSARNNNQFLGERDFVAYDNSLNEDDTHGFYCLSTIASNAPGKLVGTAPKANFWLLRTENPSTEFPVEEHNWAVGAEFADSAGADMISSSLGYTTFDDGSFDHTYNDFYKNATTVSKAATLAARKGMIVMNSAGNEGNNSWKYISFPADADSVCAVGAIDNQKNIASFSGYGYPGKIKPNIVSVGQGTVIASLFNTTATGSGTSFSNPNIAGLIACLWQAFRQFNNMEILDAVYKSSDRYLTPDNRYGFGIPDMQKAFSILQNKALVQKYGTGFWITANPSPFKKELNVMFNSTESGKAELRLTDAAGRTIETKILQVTSGSPYTISFTSPASLSAGIYFIQFASGSTKHSLKVLKQ